MNKYSLLFTALVLFSTSTLISAEKNGKVEFTISFPAPNPEDGTATLARVEKDILYALSHKNSQISGILTDTPGTALIVGVGTAGAEAIVAASKVLPPGSTFVVLQHSLKDKNALVTMFQNTLPNGNENHFVISDPIELGDLTAIEEFFTENKNALSKTILFVHAADRAERYIPDSLPVDDVIAQIVRRASGAKMSEMLNAWKSDSKSIVNILISSECNQNRDCYRIPNLGPYQMGKIVGDELFRVENQGKNAVTIIAFSGPMATNGQRLARTQEYNKLKNSGKDLADKNAEEYIFRHFESVDIDPMDSVGMIYKVSLEEVIKDQLAVGEVYEIYGPSVHPDLDKEAGTLKKVESAPYLWAPFE